jgi:hypothetical protein
MKIPKILGEFIEYTNINNEVHRIEFMNLLDNTYNESKSKLHIIEFFFKNKRAFEEQWKLIKENIRKQAKQNQQLNSMKEELKSIKDDLQQEKQNENSN